MSLPRKVEEAIRQLQVAVEDDCRSPHNGLDSLKAVRHEKLVDAEREIRNAIDRAIASAYKRAAVVCEDLADRIDEKRGTASDPAAIDAQANVAMECAESVRRIAKALLEKKPCSTS